MERLLGADGWLRHQRESWAWMEGRFVPYPVQNNIRHLKPETLHSCLMGLIEAQKKPMAGKPAHFGEWIQAMFGEGLARVFMRPYNYKVWAYEPEDMAYQWIGERVAVTDLSRVLRNVVFAQDDLSWGPNNTFQFPKEGGTGAIWERLGDLVGRERIHLGEAVTAVDHERREVTTSGGKTYRYGKLLSTMPLDRFAALVRPELPPEALQAAGRLKHSTSHIVGIGLRGAPPEKLLTKCWMYFPEGDCPFYRVTVFSNYSPANVPDINAQWSLMAETSQSPAKPVDEAQVLESTIQGLLNTGLIAQRSDVISTWKYSAPHGYPTPCRDRDAALATLMPALHSRGLYSRGRFGAWKYEVSNQDHSLMQGVEWAEHMVNGREEITWRDPERVNGSKEKL
jgi:protoporphyrinogen oxidase